MKIFKNKNNSLPQQVDENKLNIDEIIDVVDDLNNDVDALIDEVDKKQYELVAGTNITLTPLPDDKVRIDATDRDTNVDVKVDGVSITHDKVADIKTINSDYNENTNKIATSNDLTSLGNTKQDALVSGTNIKTINNESLLGSGNIQIQDLTTEVKVDNVSITQDNVADIKSMNGNYNASTNKFATNSDLTALGNTKQDTLTFDNLPTQNSNNPVKSGGVYSELAGKQPNLISGTNIKTINNESLLGSGNIIIQGGQSTDVEVDGTSITSGGVADIKSMNGNYNASTNKFATNSDLTALGNTKQDTLVSGTSIKTINNESILGGGNIVIQGGGGDTPIELGEITANNDAILSSKLRMFYIPVDYNQTKNINIKAELNNATIETSVSVKTPSILIGGYVVRPNSQNYAPGFWKLYDAESFLLTDGHGFQIFYSGSVNSAMSNVICKPSSPAKTKITIEFSNSVSGQTLNMVFYANFTYGDLLHRDTSINKSLLNNTLPLGAYYFLPILQFFCWQPSNLNASTTAYINGADLMWDNKTLVPIPTDSLYTIYVVRNSDSSGYTCTLSLIEEKTGITSTWSFDSATLRTYTIFPI